MHNIRFNNWYVIDNKMVASLMNFYVEISIIDNKYVIRVVSEGVNEIFLPFNTLEDAIDFTEDKIANLLQLSDVSREYNYYYDKGKTLKKER